MTDTLVHAYLPLVIWTGLGLLVVPWIPDTLPRLLGRALYWLGVPVQIFTLARQTDFSARVTLVPAIALWSVAIGLILGSLSLWLLEYHATAADTSEPPTVSLWTQAPQRGGFLLSAMLGNTGFVGLAIVPSFIDEPYRGWIVLYSVAQNVLGTYGIGVLLASFYGRSQAHHPWSHTLRDILTVPSLWAFGAGMLSRSFVFPEAVDIGLHLSLRMIIPAALLLMGIRLRQIQGWQGLKRGLIPSAIKVLGMPLLIGLTAIALDLPPSPRLAIVLMAGMPTAFAGLILAEEYELDRELIASSIVVSTVGLFLTIPLWLLIFGVEETIF